MLANITKTKKSNYVSPKVKIVTLSFDDIIATSMGCPTKSPILKNKENVNINTKM